jgi:glycosyltransferase involved in cell wall biosynthesis
MRVAYVCTDPGIPVFGRKGASVHIQSVLTAMLDIGAEIDLVTVRLGGEPPPELAGVTVHQLALPEANSPALREAGSRRADAMAAETLTTLARDHPIDLVYERYSLWGRGAMAWARRNAVPSILEVNAPLVDEQAAHRVLVDRAAAERVAAETISAAATVVCVSEPVASWARARSRCPERVHTVANGVDTARIRPSVSPPPESPFTVGFVGTLKPWHGVDDLIRAIGLLGRDDRSYRLVIVGDGPQSRSLHEQVRRLGMGDMVALTGSVSPEQVRAWMHRMHVAVAPYPSQPDFYFSPLKIYEYFAAGLPVIATDVGDLATVMAYGELGVLVPASSPVELAAAIAGLRADPGRRQRLGRAARAAAVARHDWSGVVARILDLTGVAHGAA